MIGTFPKLIGEFKMNAKMDLNEPEGPEIQPSLILEFLIKRCNEFIQSENPRFPFLLQGLALAGLETDKDLLDDYMGLLASPILPPAEIFRRAVEIFQIALERDPDSRHSQPPNEQTVDDQEPDEKCGRQIIMNALREGKIMLDQADFRFLRLFEVLGWAGLQHDPASLAEFEAVRSSLRNDPESMVLKGREILKDAIFRRNRH
jgi:hypothetical protein